MCNQGTLCCLFFNLGGGNYERGFGNDVLKGGFDIHSSDKCREWWNQSKQQSGCESESECRDREGWMWRCELEARQDLVTGGTEGEQETEAKPSSQKWLQISGLPAPLFESVELCWRGTSHWRSAFFKVQLSHLYMTTGKTITLTIWTLPAKWCLCFLICYLDLS